MGAVSKLLFAFLFVSLSIASSAQAELRAFKLTIKDTENQTEREVITRFDHEQYPMYHYLRRTEVVTIAQTWMCYDRSDYKGQLCPAPPAESPETQGRRPASTK